MAYKQLILIRQDLKLPKGKACSQVAHAAVEAVLKSKPSIIDSWRDQGMKKIVVKVTNLRELLKYRDLAKKEKLVYCIIKDAGRTTIKAGTITCIGIGPDSEEKISKFTKELKLL